MRRIGIFLSHLFMGSLFVFSGVSKIFDWGGAERGFASVLGDWHTLSFHSLQNLFAILLSWSSTLIVLVTAIEILGGVFIILGMKVRFFVFLLLLIFLPMTFLLHPFWFFEGSKAEMQLILFMKNVAIMGGLLHILILGGKERFTDVDFES